MEWTYTSTDMRNGTLFLALLVMLSCQHAAKVEWVSTTFENPWQVMEAAQAEAPAEASVVLDLQAVNQTVEGFGTCFNELGCTSLSELSEMDRAAILEDLFTPTGMNLTMARMPLGFLNPDGRTVLLLANQSDTPKTVSVEGLPGRLGLSGHLGRLDRPRVVTLPAGSINTLVF